MSKENNNNTQEEVVEEKTTEVNQPDENIQEKTLKEIGQETVEDFKELGKEMKEEWNKDKPKGCLQWIGSIIIWTLMLSFIVNVYAAFKDFDNSNFGQMIKSASGDTTYEDIVLNAETRYGYTVREAFATYFEGMKVDTNDTKYGMLVTVQGFRMENGLDQEYEIKFKPNGQNIGDFALHSMSQNYVPLLEEQMNEKFAEMMNYRTVCEESQRIQDDEQIEQPQPVESTNTSEYGVSIAMNKSVVNDIVMYANEDEMKLAIEELSYNGRTIGGLIDALDNYTFNVESTDGEYIFSVCGDMNEMSIKMIFKMSTDKCMLDLTDVYVSSQGDTNSERINKEEYNKLNLL